MSQQREAVRGEMPLKQLAEVGDVATDGVEAVSVLAMVAEFVRCPLPQQMAVVRNHIEAVVHAPNPTPR